jgi:hypothetical protein
VSVGFAHVGGVPIEETLASTGPALLSAAGVIAARLRARRPSTIRRSPAQEADQRPMRRRPAGPMVAKSDPSEPTTAIIEDARP